MVKHSWEYNGTKYEMYAWSKDCCVYQQWLKYDTFQEIIGLEKIRDLGLDGIAIDVGANVGNHAVYFATECCLKVDAYEPVAQHYYCLVVNNHLNESVINYISPFAMADKAGKVKLNYGAQAPENVWTTHDEDGDAIAYTIDGSYDATDNVALIKIDTEGTEMSVLFGAEKTIDRCKPYLFIEVVQPHKYDMVDAYLRRFGYKDLYGNIQPEGADTRIWGAR